MEQRVAHKQRLHREQQLLRRRLDLLMRDQYRVNRTFSESSTGDFYRNERTNSECSVDAFSTTGGSTGSIDSG